MAGYDLRKLKAHPLCKLRMMRDDEFREFCEAAVSGSIRIYPVLVYDGYIIDGRDRQRMHIATGVPVGVEEWKPSLFAEGDPAAIDAELRSFINNVNRLRKQFSTAELAEQAEICAATLAASAEAPRGKKEARREAARQVGASERSVERREFVTKHAQPEVKSLLADGIVELGAADKLAHLAPDEQRFAARKVREGVAPGDAVRLAKEDSKERARPHRVDAAGFRVPAWLNQTFDDRDEFLRLSADLTKIRQRIEEAIKGEAGVMLASKKSEFSRGLTEMGEVLRMDCPHAICVECDGQKGRACLRCKGRGWLTRGEYNNVAEDKKRKAS